MKNIFLAAVLVFSTNAFASKPVLNCSSKLGENKIAIAVSSADGIYTAILDGVSMDGEIQAVVYQKILPDQVKEIPGAQEIINELKLSESTLKKVKSIDTYLVGNLQDDGAGVLAISLKSARGKILGKGMFFGWAGPLMCDP